MAVDQPRRGVPISTDTPVSSSRSGSSSSAARFAPSCQVSAGRDVPSSTSWLPSRTTSVAAPSIGHGRRPGERRRPAQKCARTSVTTRAMAPHLKVSGRHGVLCARHRLRSVSPISERWSRKRQVAGVRCTRRSKPIRMAGRRTASGTARCRATILGRRRRRTMRLEHSAQIAVVSPANSDLDRRVVTCRSIVPMHACDQSPSARVLAPCASKSGSRRTRRGCEPVESPLVLQRTTKRKGPQCPFSSA